ncbi:hypothetical protein BGZ46_004267 [Entomortierella lignicola]|nr:hypothetical protein BGZ46_004267 [Entomortierella lignicola]
MSMLRRHGSYVVSLDSIRAHESSFEYIRTFCPYVQSLSLTFDDESSKITYLGLEIFFLKMPSITTLHVRFDASQFRPAMFWSLSQLANMHKLSIDVYFGNSRGSKHYRPEVYLSILDCCPKLDELTVYGQFLEPADAAEFHRTSSFSQRIRWLLDGTPSTSQEAITTPIHTRSKSYGSTISRIGRSFISKENASESTMALRDYKIRKLELRSPRMDDLVLCNLARHCPLLEELIIDGLWIRISLTSWETISSSCPHFRSLTVRDSGAVDYLPSISSLLTMFPSLESINIMALEFKTDPDLSTLGVRLREIEQQRGRRHPLKQIHLSGSILKPIKLLLDITTQCSTIESLSVGFMLNTLRVLENEPNHVDENNNLLNELKKKWLCQDNLLHLDLTGISFKTKSVLKKFFTQVQRLTRLKSLWISVPHLREAMIILSRSQKDGIRDTTSEPISPSAGDASSSAPTRIYNYSSRFFFFYSLEIIRIGIACYQSKKKSELPVVYNEVAFIIGRAPLLRQVELKHMSEAGIVKQLSLEYPRIEFS